MGPATAIGISGHPAAIGWVADAAKAKRPKNKSDKSLDDAAGISPSPEKHFQRKCMELFVVSKSTPTQVSVVSSRHRLALDLDVELHRPRGHRHEGAGRRVDRKVFRINPVDGGVEAGIGGVDAHHHHLVE